MGVIWYLLRNVQVAEAGYAVLFGSPIAEEHSLFFPLQLFPSCSSETQGTAFPIFPSAPWSYRNPLNTCPLMCTVAKYAYSSSPFPMAETL